MGWKPIVIYYQCTGIVGLNQARFGLDSVPKLVGEIVGLLKGNDSREQAGSGFDLPPVPVPESHMIRSGRQVVQDSIILLL